jgi:hypothetical protein
MSYEESFPPHTAEDFAGRGFLLQRVLVSLNGPRHSENGTHTRTVILSKAKNPDRDGQGCHGLRELFSAVTRAVACALNPRGMGYED